MYLQDRQPGEEKIIKRIAFSSAATLPAKEKKDFDDKKFKFFTDILSWKEDLSHIDFFYGGRVHGAICALNSGVPSIVINEDSRAREMCEYLNIPYFSHVPEKNDIFDLIDSLDYSRLNTEYNKKWLTFVEFLKENEFEYNPIPEQIKGIDLPIYKNMQIKQMGYLKEALTSILRRTLSGQLRKFARGIYRKRYDC